MYDLFGRCICALCVALELMVCVINSGHPTDIHSFCDYICAYIVNSREGERSTRLEVARHINRFRKWCVQQGITDISMVKQDDVEAFVHSPVMAGGRARRPGWSTRKNRRLALRKGFRAARNLGYEMLDPTIDVAIVADRTVDVNLCTDDDIERLRDGTPLQLFSVTWTSVIALAEAGATNSEIRFVRASDVDIDENVVHLAGNKRVDERVNSLTDWGVIVLSERLSELEPDDLVVTNGDDRQCSEATISQMFKHMVNYANLGSRGLTINSVRGWRAKTIYEQTGRIQDASLFLGNHSLDTSAQLIGLDWRESA